MSYPELKEKTENRKLDVNGDMNGAVIEAILV